MLPWIQRVGIVATVLSTGVITPIAPALAQTSATLPDGGRAPGLLRKIPSNLRAQPASATPIGNVRVTVGPNGETRAQTYLLPRGSTAATLRLGAAQATLVKPAAAEIVCLLQINNPHDSGHNPGSANVTGSISCDAVMPFMEIGVALYLNGYLLASKYYDNTNATYVTTNAAAPCVLPGVYEGGAVGYVVAPPGFVPPASNWGGEEFFSTPVYLVC